MTGRRLWTVTRRRLAQGIVALLVLSVISFIISHSVGSPLQVLLPATASPSQFAALGKSLGLNRPLPVQFGTYLWRLLHGNFGQSVFWHSSVTSLIASHFTNSLKLGGVAIIATIVISVPLGMAAAMWNGKLPDQVVRFGSAVGQSIPSFLAGLLLLQIFSVNLNWFPSSRFGSGPGIYVLPAGTLVLFEAPSIVRLIRTQAIGQLRESYISFVRINGASQLGILRHLLPNALGPALAYAGADFIRAFLTGTVVVETIFSWPGIGYLTFQAVQNRDFPVIQGLLIFIGILYLLVSAVTELLAAYLDPRVGSTALAAEA
jgi:peptide/nickel transport system permease protein